MSDETEKDLQQKMPPPSTESIEKEQEAKLRSKYPGIRGPGSQAFLQKRISRGNKYFDSGDYNLAKSKAGPTSKKPINVGGKLLIPNSTVAGAHPTPESVHMHKPGQTHQVSKLAASEPLGQQ